MEVEWLGPPVTPERVLAYIKKHANDVGPDVYVYACDIYAVFEIKSC